jgi:signal peptidase II
LQDDFPMTLPPETSDTADPAAPSPHGAAPAAGASPAAGDSSIAGASPAPDVSGSAEASGDGPPAAHAPRRYAHPLELGTMAVVVALDQVTKAIVRYSLPLNESRSIIPQLLDLTHVHNTGAAFGLMNAADFPYKPTVMIAVAAVALVAIAAYATQLGFHERIARFGLALILGGAFGNLIDRAANGYVIDFVDVYWGSAHFWAFNVADAGITIGAILVLLDMIGLGRRHASHPL